MIHDSNFFITVHRLYICVISCVLLDGSFHPNVALQSSSVFWLLSVRQQMMSHETQTPLVISLWRWTGHMSQCRPPTPSLCTDPALLLLNTALSETRWLSFGLYCIFVFSAYFHKSNKWTVTPRASLKAVWQRLKTTLAPFSLRGGSVGIRRACRNVPLIKFAPKTS